MAKPLNERITSARSTNRITIADLTALIAEIGEEQSRLAASHAQAEADSVDIALSEPDRDEAAAKAGRMARMAAGYKTARAELEEKLQAKLDSDAQVLRRAEVEDAKGERDRLADRWREAWPRLTAELIDLFQATLASDARLARLGLHNEPSAEAVARGLQKNFSDGYGYQDRLTDMKLMPLETGPRIWPFDNERAAAAAMSNVAPRTWATSTQAPTYLPKIGARHGGVEAIEQ